MIERGIVRTPQDDISAEPTEPLEDGSVIEYRPAVSVTLVVDNVARQLRTPAQSVRELLATERVNVLKRDKVSPQARQSFSNDAIIRVDHVNTWIARVHQSIAAPVKRHGDFRLPLGATRVIDAGALGSKELTYTYTQPNRAYAPHRSLLVARTVRAPRARVIALGVGEYASFANLATRGMEGTVKLASAALTMIATAYTANCYGCSGITAIGKAAGHGIVAVDPRVIPLGSHLYIPGYGHALAGDTGGAIVGKRIDLGFNSNGDALSFGRRAITVYVLK